MFKRIVIPVDGSATSNKALTVALQMARDTGGSVRIVHVIEGTNYSSNAMQTEGFAATRQVDPNIVIKKKNGQDTEVQDGWKGRILPFELVQERIATYLGEAVRQRAQAQYVARLLGGCRIEGIEVPSPGELNVH